MAKTRNNEPWFLRKIHREPLEKVRPSNSSDQARVLHESNQGPAEAIDPQTQERYILVPREIYERLHSLLDGDFSVEDAFRAQIEAAAAAGWDDPALDVYNDFKPEKS